VNEVFDKVEWLCKLGFAPWKTYGSHHFSIRIHAHRNPPFPLPVVSNAVLSLLLSFENGFGLEE